MQERLLEAQQMHEASEAKGTQLEELLAEQKSAMVEKEEELAETIDRLEDEKRQVLSLSLCLSLSLSLSLSLTDCLCLSLSAAGGVGGGGEPRAGRG